MRAWLITYVTAEPLEAAAMGAALLFSIVAVLCAWKLGREVARELRDAEGQREDWINEGNVR